jgi:aminomethyltransferase
METALHDVLTACGAALGEYRGTESAARFTHPRTEYEVLRSGCALYELGWRSKLLVTGPDRTRWLNGMVTNNVRDLAMNRGLYCFLLNAQGRIQGDMYVYNRGEHLLVDTDQSQRERLLEIFEKFIIMDDVEVRKADDQLTSIGIRGPLAIEVLGKAGLSTENLASFEVRDATWNGIGLSIVRTDQECSFELWLAPSNAAALWKTLVGEGAAPVGFEALERARVASGVPLYGQDIRERDLPQETGQQRALHFQKGCYVGQEIVERIHSRGNVHRQFVGLSVEGALPPPGSKIQAGEKEIGEITSASALPTGSGDRRVALGYVRREFAGSGDLHVDGARVRVRRLPFEKI